MTPKAVGWIVLWAVVLMAVSGFCGTRMVQDGRPAPAVSSR